MCRHPALNLVSFASPQRIGFVLQQALRLVCHLAIGEAEVTWPDSLSMTELVRTGHDPLCWQLAEAAMPHKAQACRITTERRAIDRL